MQIYSNKDGSLPDISHLDVQRKGRLKIFIIALIGIILVLAAIFWLSFIIFNPSNGSGSVKMEIKGQQSIASGDEVTYVLEYKNVDTSDLNDVEIIFRYPEGFKFVSAMPEPTNNFNSSWSIGALSRNQEGKIEIKGRLIGEIGSIKAINATASFRPENFSSVFKETTSFSSQITSSILEINLEGPEQILPEKKITYKIKYRNNSDQKLENVRIASEYPANFIFQQASPEPFSRESDARNLNNQWLIESLAENQQGEIEVTGGYLADKSIPVAGFKVQIGFLNKDSDQFALQQEKTINTEIIEPGLSINLISNGSAQDQPINFGQSLTYSIAYKNIGGRDLENVSFTVTLESGVLDWESLDDNNKGVIKDNTIAWNKDHVSKLALLKPLDEGSIDFIIRVKESSDVNLEKDDLSVKSQVVAGLTKIGSLETEGLEVSGNAINSNINTDIALKVEGRYFDDNNIAVGTGPLPPVVGETTSFRIFWSLANSLHEVNNVEVSAVLPDGVVWDDKFLVKTGQISYNSKDNEVVWKINRLSANKGFEDVNVWFDVSVTPTKQQVKRLLILTEPAVLQATDQTTDSEITKTAKAITSNLEDDPIGGGRGLVIDITE